MPSKTCTHISRSIKFLDRLPSCHQNKHNRLLCYLLKEHYQNLKEHLFYVSNNCYFSLPKSDESTIDLNSQVSSNQKLFVDRSTCILNAVVKYKTDKPHNEVDTINWCSICCFCISVLNDFIHEVFIVTEILLIFFELPF